MKNLNMLDAFGDAMKYFFTPARKPTPADFRRGVRKVRNVIGYNPDTNSGPRGVFMGDITPMKRRFKGVSRTAKKGAK